MVNFLNKLVSFGSGGFRQDEEQLPTQTLEKNGVDIDAINQQVSNEIEQVDQKTLSRDKVTEIIRGAPEGTTPDEIIVGLLDRGFSLEGLTPEAESAFRGETAKEPEVRKVKPRPSRPATKPGILKRAGEAALTGLVGPKSAREAAAAGVAQLPEIVSNIGGFFIGKPVDALLEKAGVDAPSLEAQFKKDGINTKAKFQEVLGVDPDEFTTQIGEFGSEVGTLFIPGGQSKLISKFPAAADKIKKLGTAVENLGTKGKATFNTLKSALTGAKEFGKFELVSEGEVTPETLAIGAVANPVLAKGFQLAGKATQGIADKLQLSGLLNPAKLAQVSQQLKADGIEKLTVAEHLLKNNIKGSKEQVVKKLNTLAKESKGKVDTGLASVNTKFKNVEPVEEALSELRSKFSGKIGLKDEVNNFSNLLVKSNKGEGLTLSEINSVKRSIDELANPFAVTGEEKAASKGINKVRSSIQQFIEKESTKAGVKGIKQLNKNTQVNRTLANAIERKEAQVQARELITAFGPTGFGGLLGGIQGSKEGGDVFTVLRNVVLGGIGGGIAGSTTVKTNAAKFFNKLSGQEKFALLGFLESKGSKSIATGLFNKLMNTLE